MQDTPQTPEQPRHGISLPPGIDPRKALDPAAVERVVRAQAVARAQAQAATTVVVSTVVSLVTSAFGFVAALAWNNAITKILQDRVMPSLQGTGLGAGGVLVIYAILVTLLAIVVVFLINRIASRWVKKTATEAAKAEQGLL
jgi:hypothetical protein